MDIFDEDLLAFWRTLNKEGVRYIMVGGVATNLNGYQRTTEDIDIWLDDTLQNREQFRLAFKAYSGTFRDWRTCCAISGKTGIKRVTAK